MCPFAPPDEIIFLWEHKRVNKWLKLDNGNNIFRITVEVHANTHADALATSLPDRHCTRPQARAWETVSGHVGAYRHS